MNRSDRWLLVLTVIGRDRHPGGSLAGLGHRAQGGRIDSRRNLRPAHHLLPRALRLAEHAGLWDHNGGQHRLPGYGPAALGQPGSIVR